MVKKHSINYTNGGKIMTTERKKAENLIYGYFDILDKTRTNSAYYKDLFSKMSDAQFMNFCKRKLPFRFQTRPFEIEPNMTDIKASLDFLNVPMTERVNQGYVYKNSEGVPVQSQPCNVVYLHVKRLKQLNTKKLHISINSSQRDMKSGRLVADSKGGQETDREFEAAAALGLEYTIDELARPRADAMRAKSIMNSIISTTGSVSQADIPVSKEDSLSNNLLNAYLISCHIKSNLITDDDYFINTIKDKQRRVEREV